MNPQKNICILGGDARQIYLARLLAKDGHRVYIYALEQAPLQEPSLIPVTSPETLSAADVVILPLPVATREQILHAPLSELRIPIPTLFGAFSPHQLLLGGQPDARTRAMAKTGGLTLLDYFAREELAVANCVPTAEGCIQLALNELPITIHGARVLILGYGRVGKITARRFAALGGLVTVAARKHEQLAWAEADGFQSRYIHDLLPILPSADLVINTVPAPILCEPELETLSAQTLIIDLASSPGGVDTSAADRLARWVIHAHSLPGKTAPATAGAILKQCIDHMLSEHRV